MFKKIIVLLFVLFINLSVFSIAHVPPSSSYPEISKVNLDSSTYVILDQGEDFIIVEIDGKTYIHWI
jgi:hypothetical protein